MEAEGTGPIAKELAGVDAADLVGGMLEADPVGMLIAGPDGAVLAANRLAGEVFAVDPGALSGVPIAELLGDVAFETGGAGEILDAEEAGGSGARGPRRATASRRDDGAPTRVRRRLLPGLRGRPSGGGARPGPATAPGRRLSPAVGRLSRARPRARAAAA